MRQVRSVDLVVDPFNVDEINELKRDATIKEQVDTIMGMLADEIGQMEWVIVNEVGPGSGWPEIAVIAEPEVLDELESLLGP